MPAFKNERFAFLLTTANSYKRLQSTLKRLSFLSGKQCSHSRPYLCQQDNGVACHPHLSPQRPYQEVICPLHQYIPLSEPWTQDLDTRVMIFVCLSLGSYPALDYTVKYLNLSSLCPLPSAVCFAKTRRTGSPQKPPCWIRFLAFPSVCSAAKLEPGAQSTSHVTTLWQG